MAHTELLELKVNGRKESKSAIKALMASDKEKKSKKLYIQVNLVPYIEDIEEESSAN